MFAPFYRLCAILFSIRMKRVYILNLISMYLLLVCIFFSPCMPIFLIAFLFFQCFPEGTDMVGILDFYFQVIYFNYMNYVHKWVCHILQNIDVCEILALGREKIHFPLTFGKMSLLKAISCLYLLKSDVSECNREMFFSIKTLYLRSVKNNVQVQQLVSLYYKPSSVFLVLKFCLKELLVSLSEGSYQHSKMAFSQFV